MTKAQELFEASRNINRFEAELHECIGEDFPYDDFTYDWYDESLEIFGLPKERDLTEDELARLRDFGFGQVWTHTRKDSSYADNGLDARRAAGERHYSLIETAP